jgi:PAS domain S-box-containing protein
MPPQRTRDSRFRTASTPPGEIAAALSQPELTEQFNALRSVTETTLAHLPLSDLLDALLERLRELIHVDTASVLLCGTDNQLVVRASKGMNDEVEENVQIPLGQGISGAVAVRREAVIVDDVSQIETGSPALQRLRSMMVAPLLVGGDLLGIVHVGTFAARHFRDAELHLLQVVADRLALAVRNALLFDELRARIAAQEDTVQALQESEERYRSLFAHNPDPAFALDEHGRFVEVNDAAAQVSGYSIDELTGSSFVRLIAEDCREKTLTAFQHARQGTPRHLETALHHKRGHRIELSVAAVPTLADGVVKGVFGIAEDITERKHTEEALRTSEARYRSLIEATAAIAWIVAADGLVTQKQPGWSAFTGQSWAEYRGIGWLEAVHPEDRDQTVDAWRQTMKNRSNHQVEHRLRRHDGEYRHMHVRAVPIRGEDGSIREWVGIHFDVTEQVQARQQIERLYEQVKNASQAKTDFLATISHELRTPLNAIIGYAQLLEDGIPEPIPDSARQRASRIHYSAEHLRQLIEEILTFSRIEADRERVDVQSFPLPELVEQIRAVIEPLASEKSLDLRIEEPSAPVELRTDARKLRQILLNLLHNAVKFTAEGEVALSVRADEADLRFEVHDTGIGIEPANVDRIFEPFWQVEQTMTRSAEGAGLGLAVVRRLTELLGGELRVESTPGQGSTFRGRVPRVYPLPETAAV